jgi:hypothetical protein
LQLMGGTFLLVWTPASCGSTGMQSANSACMGAV